MVKLASIGGGATGSISLQSNGNDGASQTTYTFTQSCSKVTIPIHYWINGSGAQATHVIDAWIKRGNTTVWSHNEASNYYAGAIDKTETCFLTDVETGEVLTFYVNCSGRYSSTSQVAYGGMTCSIVGQQAGAVERNLLPTEVKGLGEQAVATLFGRMDNGKRYGEITGTTNTATTGNVALGNAVGYLTMEYNGYVVKVPYYN